ncbi:MAG: bifunctional D-glycero-beta-D-manno-heptose-7-phosphate kinase/D-glycero-beta-D-manno-heptose 1-phosphate adenylyltransferase HldE [Desulfatitalea sp.]|nr:bifunctional D-glycero-beta-D-manno-heptose-7-phosphate kinase/D-glycero-beta-D-manno-heptose 1-phosphate adenylyltransferase HldE [Desulfatitalea sp.]NNK02165.1 bifunctional D-glycero-beta-D-manno-heptose-7-phosphate kinase/D-glycero-beta-D-manno-heptose 1-phosphate adenylyltransferase HldE [Desulfatitalea sp.]
MSLVWEALKSTEILVVGDIMLDRYIWGRVGRISPEAPVPVVHRRQVTETLGGAGNVALNLVSLGCRTSVVSVCGTDAEAGMLDNRLSEKGIRAYLVTDPGRPTTTKTRILANQQQMLRLDHEQTHPLPADVQERVMQSINNCIPRAQVVVISDYAKGMFSGKGLAQEIIALARGQGIPVLVDPKGLDWERYRDATGITPNTAELEGVTGTALAADESALVASAKQMRQHLALDWLLVTRGGQGMCLVGQYDSEVLISAQAREVYDVSGAGDTVIATMAAALASGLPATEAARLANLAGGIVVGKLGTQPILASELATALKYNDLQRFYPFAAGKVADIPAAKAKVDAWRIAGDTIVFTNGCFDLLHPGHISLLYQARAMGDRLVVGLNTDASIKRLKGSSRPILSEPDRAAMLGALACVDMVVCFAEDTPLTLIRALKPDILVKGSDYAPGQVVGKAVVESYGGRVRLVDIVQGYSTTRLTEQVAAGTGKNEKTSSTS